MSSVKNSVRLIGNLGKAPEAKSFENGKKVVKTSMATSEKYTDSAGLPQTETTWHNLVFWNRSAEIAEKYLDKGDKIAIEGKIRSYTFTDKEGNKRFMNEIVVSNFEMLGNRKAKAEMAVAAGDTSDDLPF